MRLNACGNGGLGHSRTGFGGARDDAFGVMMGEVSINEEGYSRGSPMDWFNNTFSWQPRIRRSSLETFKQSQRRAKVMEKYEAIF